MRADARKNYDQLLDAARIVIAGQGADASLRDVARRADVVVGTLYRHFPTREALLEALLRTGFDELTDLAADLERRASVADALVIWLRDCVAFARTYRGVTTVMVAAIEAPDSALHDSCTAMKAAGARLLERAQAGGQARSDLDGVDLFALIAALAWIGDQPATADRADHLFDIVTDAVLPLRHKLVTPGN